MKEEGIAIAALLHDIYKADEYKIKLDGTPAHKEASAHLGGYGDMSVILILFHGFKLEGEELLPSVGIRVQNTSMIRRKKRSVKRPRKKALLYA